MAAIPQRLAHSPLPVAVAARYADGAVAERPARRPAVATSHRFGVPIVPLVPKGLNLSADLEWPWRECCVPSSTAKNEFLIGRSIEIVDENF